MKTQAAIEGAQVKQRYGRINTGQMGLHDAEQRILEFLNWVGE